MDAERLRQIEETAEGLTKELVDEIYRLRRRSQVLLVLERDGFCQVICYPDTAIRTVHMVEGWEKDRLAYLFSLRKLPKSWKRMPHDPDTKHVEANCRLCLSREEWERVKWEVAAMKGVEGAKEFLSGGVYKAKAEMIR